jgi:broad specificity phosphatase PhoE
MPSSVRRLLLVRHGRSAHVHRGWIDRAGLDAFFTAYDAAGVAADDAPPPALRTLAHEVGLVVTSDLPRARASAERLLSVEAALRAPASPLLREIPLPLPAWTGVRLPLAAWALAVGAGAVWRRVRTVPPPDAVTAQAREAAAWLGTLADAHGSVLAVTHAAFRGHLARALAAEGWSGPRRRSHRHWSAWELTAAR